MSGNNQPVEVLQVTNIAQLERRKINVRIQDKTDKSKVWVLELRELTFDEYWSVEWELPDPTPPTEGFQSGGIPIHNTDNGVYRAEMQRIVNDRNYRRLLLMIGDDKVNGATKEEKLATLKATLPFGVVRAINEAQARVATQWSAAVADIGERFQPIPSGGVKDMS